MGQEPAVENLALRLFLMLLVFFQKILQNIIHLLELDQESIMAMDRLDFGIMCIWNQLRKPALLDRRIKQIRTNPNAKHLRFETAQNIFQLTAPSCNIVQVHRTRDVDISVRIEPLDNFHALIMEVALNLKNIFQIKKILLPILMKSIPLESQGK